MNTTINQLPDLDSSALTKRAMLVSLTINKPSNSKQDKDASKETVASHQAAEGAARVSKTLFDKEKVEWFAKPAGAARNDLYEMTQPWLQSGVRILSVENYFKLIEKMKTHEAAFWAGAERFLGKYEELIEQSKISLGTLFREDDYLTLEEMREKFGFELKFTALTDASDWRVALGIEEEERIKADIRAQMQRGAIEATKETWSKVKTAVEALAERLEVRAAQEMDPNHQGRKTPIKEALLDNLSNLVSLLPGFNLYNDPQITQVAEEISKLVDSTSPDELKDNPVHQIDVAKKARELEERVAQYGSLLS